MEQNKIACIGCGSMGGAIMSAICRNGGADTVTVTARRFANAQRFAAENGCRAAETNDAAVSGAKYVFLAVKPALVREVLEGIRKSLEESAVIISMAAGISLKQLAEVHRAPYIRIMPNMPAKIGEAMTALCCTDDVPAADRAEVARLLGFAGKVEAVDERLMDCVTAVSGSGPAYAFIFLEALADAAVRFGMPRAQAYIYAAQTLKGAAAMVLETGSCPAELKDAVCSPAGTTIEAVAALEGSGFRGAVIDAATAAWKKSQELARR
ncbi:MAG: pyrroline-5-carboxylate reductase [Treponemataceae bacterium]|nr:pyrroline-5-carboxylate reductase [Treponemataceae bacterium]